ncbi:MAG: dihydrolipoyl dehydrogenase [Proteobacteria bacterium TMED51]|jgi:dihydrolipoamide dehydrogenase|nr:MAG: dihydrolipoyl dehydrogenase [Proteobacteria bacterium TMED51]HCL95035.1 dihydrolipoyl dehydrogenase [Gammaproteobacteria bacterium]|tara:strand:+ start:683 stop:2092 length:1410 start_codon:yes stop_codon:yes gene_type:complete
MERSVDVAVIGAGTAGLAAVSQVRQANKSFVLINGGELGTTCARVGCMPSKALIQVGHDLHRRQLFDREGIEGGEGLSANLPDILEHVRDLRDILVDRVLGNSTDQMEEEFLDGYARFVEPGRLQVGDDVIQAENIIIACGTRPVVPPAWVDFGDRIITSDTLFEQEDLPESVAVVGLGIIGLELGQALAQLGIAVTGIDQAETLAGLSDPSARQSAIEVMSRAFPLWLGHTAELRDEEGRIRVSAGEQSVVVDKVLAAMGRQPNLDWLALEHAGIALDDQGAPSFDPATMRCGDSRVFIAGDISGSDQVLHEAAAEGRIAGYNAARDKSIAFARKTPLAITFSSPNICTVGTPYDVLDPEEIETGEMRLGPVGRALLMGANRGIIRLYADKRNGVLLGATVIAERGEHLAHLLAWCIGEKMTVLQLLRKPFYHPTMEEAIQGALKDLLQKLDLPTSPPDIPPELEALS